MDMWPAYITATRQAIEGADEKIVFDRFHVAQYMSRAVDLVRRQEHRTLMREGDQTLKGSKYQWLRSLSNMNWHQRRQFAALRTSALKTARAWAMKEFAATLWNYTTPGWVAGAGSGCWGGWRAVSSNP